MEVDREVYGDRHPEVAAMLNNLGLAWHSLGDSKKAVEYTQQAYTIYQEIFGDQHPKTKLTKDNLEAIKDKNK